MIKKLLVIPALLLASNVMHAEDIQLLEIGDFSSLGVVDAKRHWKAAGYAGTTPGNELEWKSTADGQVYARVNAKAEDENRRLFICQTMKPTQVNKSWETLELKAVYRVNEINPKPAGWQNFRFSITWYDDAGENITPGDGSFFFFKESATTDGWKVAEVEFLKPANATSFDIDFGSQGGELVADVAQISLKPVGVSVESSPIPKL